jgi:hypothetical protein
MNQKQNDFDQWIRKLADEAESPFHEASWLKMEELLDDKKKKRIFWWIWPLGIGSAITIFGLIYFLVNTNNHFNRYNQAFATNTKTHRESESPALGNSPVSYTIKSTIQNAFLESANPNEINELSFADGSKLTSSGTDTKANKESGKSSSNANNVSTLSNREQDLRISRKKGKNIKPQPGPDKAITLISSDKEEEKKVNTSIDEDVQSAPVGTSSSQKKRNPISVYSLSNDLALLSPKTGKLKIPVVPNTLEKPKTKLYSAVLMSIHASPEITTVPGRSYGSTSSEYGFNISYQITPHLLVSTGLQETKKIYSAKQGDYEIAYSDYLYNKVIENIEGVCKVIEWPISIGYKFRALGNNYFQVNAGLASIRMNKESYALDYSYSKGGKLNRKVYNFENKNWEMWSSAVFSFSYIKPITKHLSLSINPYLKTPLKGIGNGKVDLKSIGSQFGLNYSIPTTRKN